MKKILFAIVALAFVSIQTIANKLYRSAKSIDTIETVDGRNCSGI